MRGLALSMLILVGCSAPVPGVDGGAGGGGGGTGGSGGGGGVIAPPADAGVPSFTEATFCEVFARSACQWAVTCGQRTAAEEANCIAVKKHECPRALSFDAAAAQVCLLRLESARCSAALRPEGCEAAWPASVPGGGGCLTTRECKAGVCATDGGSCGRCAAPGAAGDSCDDFHPCDGANRCAAGADGGVQCVARLAAGEKCDGDDEACASGRCLFKVGKGLVCATASPGGTCASNFGCATALYCDPVRGGCRIPEPLGAVCDSQAACAANGNACLRGKCTKVAPFSVGEGAPCSETAQCQWGLACDVRAALPVCTRRVAFGADCQLNGLDVWDPRCPYLAMCHPVKQVCTEASTLCTFTGYCPSGPGPNEKCNGGAICRGLSSCVDEGDGGFRCLPTAQPAGQACFAQLSGAACTDSTCVAGVCAGWPAVPACGP